LVLRKRDERPGGEDRRDEDGQGTDPAVELFGE
jgi:hypothetical protein